MAKARNRGGVRSLTPRKVPPEKKFAVVKSPFSAGIVEFLKKGDVERAVTTLREGMKATKHEKVGRYTYAETVDHGIRMSAAKLVLEYAFGKPDVRVQVQDTGVEAAKSKEDAAFDIARKLKSSGLNIDDIIEAHTLAAKPVVAIAEGES